MLRDMRLDSEVCENARLSGRLPLAEAQRVMRLGSKQVPMPRVAWQAGPHTPKVVFLSFFFAKHVQSDVCSFNLCVRRFHHTPMNKH